MSESLFASIGRDLSIGAKQGASKLLRTASNALESVEWAGTHGSAAAARRASEELAPTPAEMAGRDGVVSQVVQGVGSIPFQVAEYAPALLAGRYRPVIAGLIGAAGAKHKGAGEMAQAAVRDALTFGVMNNMTARIPDRATRMAAEAGGAAGIAAAESGGDIKAAVSAAAVGAVAGIPGMKEERVRTRPETWGQRQADQLKKWLDAPSRGQQAWEAHLVVRDKAARLAQAGDQAEHALKQARDMFEKLKPEIRKDVALRVIDDIENERPASLPQYKAFVDTWKELQQQREKELIGRGIFEEAREWYFPHMFKDPGTAEEVYANIVASRKPLEGSKDFLKKRKYVTLADALKARPDLELLSDNPADMALLKLREIDKFLMAQDLKKELADSNLLKEVYEGSQAPKGYAFIDDKLFRERWKDQRRYVKDQNGNNVDNPNFGQTTSRLWMAPEPVATLLNNYLRPGLRQHEIVRDVMAVGNTLNMMQLGVSWFHLGMTTYDAMVSRVGLAVEQAYEATRSAVAGDSKSFTYHAKNSVRNLVRSPQHLADAGRALVGGLTGKGRLPGDRLLEAWMTGKGDASTLEMVEWMKMAGARVQLDPIYKETLSKRLRAMTHAEGSQKFFKALGIPLAVIEKPSAFMMEYIVPRQKLGVFMDLARYEMEKLGPNATTYQKRNALAKAWDSVDNRMGQTVYDNLFWNKTWKDALMLSVRSVGWNLGTILELGGGVKDLARMIDDISYGRSPELTHRTAYTVALVGIVAPLTGAIWQKLYTGEGPTEMMDYYFPKVGRVDEFGREERLQFPSYTKELFHFTHDPIRTISNKVHPVVQLINDLTTNKDYFNTMIVYEDDPALRQLKSLADYAGRTITPMSFQTLQKNLEKGASKTEIAAGLFGVTAVPAYLKKTRLEAYLSELAGKDDRPRTPYDAARRKKTGELERLIRSGKKKEAAAKMTEYLRAGEIFEKDARNAVERAMSDSTGRTFHKLELDDALRAWDVASDEEKRKIWNVDGTGPKRTLAGMLMEKVSNRQLVLSQMPADYQAQYGKRIRVILREAREKGYPIH